MKIWRKALILGGVTESATVAWFIVARGSNDDLPGTLVILHYPAIFLTLIGAPWLLAVLIETAVWVLVWFLLFHVFAPPRDELTVLSFSDSPGEGHEPQVKKIVPR
jgi:hypothetical protein